ncbi:MAG: translation initiation factor IF-3 [Candidatus Shikimatogenerans sp. Ttur]|uniref:Translation initiation factor IF-3 n=1 Tax=Candidatus Shikimatogenerans sp. Ttur TaxID=3158569 RepID=A0AAU7ZXF8_9FLAO
MYIKKVNINDIKNHPTIKLVGNNIKNGIYHMKKAIKLSNIMNLDLVIINYNNIPPIGKIINYSKFLYNFQKKKKKKKNKIKYIRINPNINKYDLKCKIKKIKKFLFLNIKVKINMFFRGRTILYVKNSKNIFNYIINKLKKISFIEKKPILIGKNMFMIINKKKQYEKI